MHVYCPAGGFACIIYIFCVYHIYIICMSEGECVMCGGMRVRINLSASEGGVSVL